MSTALTLPDDMETTPTLVAPPRNPADIPWPAMLPMELALNPHNPAEVCMAYNLDRDDFLVLCEDPVFIKAYADCKEKLKTEGASFRVKAQMQAEALLTQSWKMIHDAETTPAVKADLIKHTVKWAGYEPKTGPEVGNGSNFNIQINLA